MKSAKGFIFWIIGVLLMGAGFDAFIISPDTLHADTPPSPVVVFGGDLAVLVGLVFLIVGSRTVEFKSIPAWANLFAGLFSVGIAAVAWIFLLVLVSSL